MIIACPECSGPFEVQSGSIAALVKIECPHCGFRMILDFAAANDPSLLEEGMRMASGYRTAADYRTAVPSRSLRTVTRVRPAARPSPQREAIPKRAPAAASGPAAAPPAAASTPAAASVRPAAAAPTPAAASVPAPPPPAATAPPTAARTEAPKHPSRPALEPIRVEAPPAKGAQRPPEFVGDLDLPRAAQPEPTRPAEPGESRRGGTLVGHTPLLPLDEPTFDLDDEPPTVIRSSAQVLATYEGPEEDVQPPTPEPLHAPPPAPERERSRPPSAPPSRTQPALFEQPGGRPGGFDRRPPPHTPPAPRASTSIGTESGAMPITPDRVGSSSELERPRERGRSIVGIVVLSLLLLVAGGLVGASLALKRTPDPRPLLEDLYRQLVKQ